MALPTVPAAVLDAVARQEMGKASGINVMAQRFGAVFAIAIGSAVFSAHGQLGSPAGFTAGFRPALWACVGFAALATISCFALTARAPEGAVSPEAVDVLVDACSSPHHQLHRPPEDDPPAGLASEVFDALTTITSLSSWWTRAAGSGEAGGELRFSSAQPPTLHRDVHARLEHLPGQPAPVRRECQGTPFGN